MQNSDSNFSAPFSSASSLSDQGPSSEKHFRHVMVLTDRMAGSFTDGSEISTQICNEIPDHDLTVFLERSCNAMVHGKVGERGFRIVQECAAEYLRGLMALKGELREAEEEYQRLKTKAEPFLQNMAPLLEEDEASLSGFELARVKSLKETLMECVQALTFAKYRRDQLHGRTVAYVNEVTEQLIDTIRARNLANPHLPEIEKLVKRALHH